MLSIVLAVFSALLGADNNKIIVGSLLLFSIYSICISIIGFVGMIIKKKSYIGYYSSGLWLSFIFLSFVIISIVIFVLPNSNTVCDNKNNQNNPICDIRYYLYMYLLTFIPGQFCLHVVFKIYAYVFDNIFKNDLGNYII